MPNLRIAVIGAGPSGMAVLTAFDSEKRKTGCDLPDLVCYEKQGDLGGLWNYDWRTGIGENGEPVHGSMYHDLWSNAPKECLEFPDYSFEQHFGQCIPSYMPRAAMRDYLDGRAERDQIRKYIKFYSSVLWVDQSYMNGKFEVKIKDLVEDTIHVQLFDYVIVATGHFSVPNVPIFQGFNSFAGRILHSHDFRDAKEFVGQNVLIVGSSYSAEDIGIQCYKFGAKSITYSFRSRPLGYSWPSDGAFSVVPLLEHVEANKRVFFKDGSSKEVDSIILCTGYKHHFPFLPDSLRLKTKNRLYVGDLYKGLFWVENPKLIYIGMQNQFFSFPLFEAQACYIRDVIIDRRPLSHLSTRNEMISDIRRWQSREESLASIFEAMDFQADYIQDLLDAIGEPSKLRVKQMAEIFKMWERHKVEDITTFRDRSYRSVVTGKVSTYYTKPWLKSFEDSIEEFLGNIENSFSENGMDSKKY